MIRGLVPTDMREIVIVKSKIWGFRYAGVR
jgi:hypothetical protein